MIGQITPVILTYNEAPNIGRTLEKLSWACDIVVVDSYSQDETLSIVSKFPNVRFFQRKFDSHVNQWNFAMKETNIKTEWLLALDADYVLTDDFINEIGGLKPCDKIAGYKAKFKYCIYGKQLHRSIYPPVTVLFRREKGFYAQDGHTQRLVVKGEVQYMKSYILHDDRKPLRHWLSSQDRYMQLEAEKLSGQNSRMALMDRIRKMRVVSPIVVLFYCLFVRGLVFEGLAGFFYSFQRMAAELILSFYLIQNDLKKLMRKTNEYSER